MSEKIEILNKTPWFIYNFHDIYFILFTFSLALEWPEDQNRLSTGSSHDRTILF